jgi:hypothetical protein
MLKIGPLLGPDLQEVIREGRWDVLREMLSEFDPSDIAEILIELPIRTMSRSSSRPPRRACPPERHLLRLEVEFGYFGGVMSHDQFPYQPPENPREKKGHTVPAEAEIVFNTITGPNFRRRDNLIQLGVIVLFSIIGGFVGNWLGRASTDRDLWTVGGVFLGLMGSLALSGFIIGIVRTVLSVRKVIDQQKKP